MVKLNEIDVVIVDKSKLKGFDIDLIVGKRGSQNGYGLAMTLEEATNLRNELSDLIRDVHRFERRPKKEG